MAGFNMIVRRCVLTALLGLAAASVVVEGYAMAPKLGPGQKPLRSVVVPVHRNVREQFFSQLRFFADTHGFTIRIAPATPDDEYFGVVIHRSDILVTCDSVWNPEEFEISFYQEGNHPVASGSVDKLVGDRNKLSNRCRALQFRKRIELSAGRRTWQAADGSWHVTTHGVGNNVVPGMSEIDQWSGPDIFNELDRQMRENIERHHGSARASW